MSFAEPSDDEDLEFIVRSHPRFDAEEQENDHFDMVNRLVADNGGDVDVEIEAPWVSFFDCNICCIFRTILNTLARRRLLFRT